MGLDARQFRDFIVRPVLAHLALPGGETAERLVLATAAHESDGFRYIDQRDRSGVRPGPALGLFQMERPTFYDIWDRYLGLRPTLRARVEHFAIPLPGDDDGPLPDVWLQLAGNLYLGCAMCRVLYYARPFSMPPAASAEALWPIYKRWYNGGDEGAARREQFLAAYSRDVAPLYRRPRSEGPR